jgi:RNA polymerase sigma-70 factor (ECF subfamily)
LGTYGRHDEDFLFASIRKGDEEAFAELFNRYWTKAFFMAYQKLNDQEAAEEIVQEVFITLWDKRESLSIQNFSAYLYTCIRNKCLNYIEAKIIERKHWEFYRQFIHQSDHETEKMVSYDTLLEAIHTSMESLPKKTRRVFQLNKLEGRSVSEIANVLNLSEKAIEYHLARSLKHLRMHLKDFTLLLLLSLPM